MREIFDRIQGQELDKISMPSKAYEEALGNFECTKESIKAMDYENFELMCRTIAEGDVILLYKLLESQGYDCWLQKVAHPSF